MAIALFDAKHHRSAVRARRRRPKQHGPLQAAKRVAKAALRGGQSGFEVVRTCTAPLRFVAGTLLGDGTLPTRRDYRVEHTGLLGWPEQALQQLGVRRWDAGSRAAGGCAIGVACLLGAARLLVLGAVMLGLFAVCASVAIVGLVSGLINGALTETYAAIRRAHRAPKREQAPAPKVRPPARTRAPSGRKRRQTSLGSVASAPVPVRVITPPLPA